MSPALPLPKLLVWIPFAFALDVSAAPSAVPPAAGAADRPVIEEWVVPWPNTRPRDPSVAPDGRVWFVGQTGNYLAVFEPRDQSFRRFDLPEGTQPHTVVVDRDGYPWIAGNGNGTVVKFDPAGERFTVLKVPDTRGLKREDPHTFAFDGRGGLWFTLQQGNGIGHLDLASGTFRIAMVPTPNALPYGILADPQGQPWAVLLGTNKLATVDPQTFEVSEVLLPREKARPRRIARTADGRIWYVDFTQGYLGACDPVHGGIKEWKTPSADSGPYAMTSDDRGRVWFFETFPKPNLLQGFDSASETWLPATPVPSGGGVVRNVVFDPKTRSLWFGTDTNRLGRAHLPK